MKNSLVSVVIPVRNAEKYVEKCIESVQAQTYTDLDIIIVVNGASDQSEGICRDLASKDPRIRVIVVKESGVSKARNIGIESALGAYIIFIDADDFIHASLIGHLYKELNKNNADIATASFEKYVANALGDERHNKLRNKTVASHYYARRMLLGSFEYDGYVWGKMYRTDILSDTKFNETLTFSEDTDFLIKLLRKDLRIYRSTLVGYFYSQDTSGITKNNSGTDRMNALQLASTFISEATSEDMRLAARAYSWRNAYYILSQSKLSADDRAQVWGVMKKYRMYVITSTLSPMKYRLIAALSLLGSSVFANTVSRLVKGA